MASTPLMILVGHPFAGPFGPCHLHVAPLDIPEHEEVMQPFRMCFACTLASGH